MIFILIKIENFTKRSVGTIVSFVNVTYKLNISLDLSSLTLGTLRKAQNALSRVKVYHDSDGSEDDGSDGLEPEEEVSRPNFKGKEKEKSKEKREIEKRRNKHA